MNQTKEILELNFERIVNMQPLTAFSKRRYIHDMQNLLRYWDGEGNPLMWYQAYQYNKGNGANTILNSVQACKRVFEMCHDAGLCPDYTVGFKRKRMKRPPPKIGYTEDEVRSIWQKAREVENDKQRTRILAFLSLLSLTGMRGQGVCSINVEDVNVQQCTISVRHKGQIHKSPMKVPPQCIRYITEYMEAYKPHNFRKPDDPLFYNDRNTNGGKKLRSESTAFRNALKRIGVDIEGKSMHGLRHYFITSMLEDGFAAYEIAAYLNITVQMIYRYADMRLSPATAQKISDRMSQKNFAK